jgi:hypothetical protein
MSKGRKNVNNGFVLDTPEQINMFRLIQLKHALRLETKTGMKVGRGSLVKSAQGFGFKGRTKKAALVYIDDLIAGYEARQARNIK